MCAYSQMRNHVQCLNKSMVVFFPRDYWPSPNLTTSSGSFKAGRSQISTITTRLLRGNLSLLTPYPGPPTLAQKIFLCTSLEHRGHGGSRYAAHREEPWLLPQRLPPCSSHIYTAWCHGFQGAMRLLWVCVFGLCFHSETYGL